MAKKCDICKSKIQLNFLDKVMGTYIKDEDHKQKIVCFECQSKFKTKDEILEALKTNK